MENLKKSSKLILFISLLSGILWLGGYTARLLITFQLFEPKDWVFKQYINTANLTGIYITLTPVITFTLITYLIFIICFTLFLIVSKVNLKTEGWLLIIALIIFITAPFELYLMTIDLKIVTNLTNSNFVLDKVTQLIIKRMSLLSNFSLIEIFSYLGIIFLVVLKPLRLKK